MKTTLFITLVCSFLFYNPIFGQNISGTFETNFGTMYLTQSGNSVTGSYTSQNGKVNGTLTGNIFKGRWDEDNNDYGRFEFTFNEDFTSFTGIWSRGEGELGGSWHGSKGNSSAKENINCHTLFGLGKLVGTLEVAALEGYDVDFMVKTIDFALNHIGASNCLSSAYLLDLKSRIKTSTNTKDFYNEIKSYGIKLESEIATSCGCCGSCQN